MEGAWQHLGRLCKRGLAAALFCLLVVGASAAALTAVAAGIRALSGDSRLPGAEAGLPAETRAGWSGGGYGAGAAVGPGGAGSAGRAGGADGAGAAGWTGGRAAGDSPRAGTRDSGGQAGAPVSALPGSAGAGAGAAPAAEPSWSRAYSPVTHALDAGGVAVGLRVQQVFGHLLSGVLQTLFFEQVDDAPSAADSSAAPGAASARFPAAVAPSQAGPAQPGRGQAGSGQAGETAAAAGGRG